MEKRAQLGTAVYCVRENYSPGKKKGIQQNKS